LLDDQIQMKYREEVVVFFGEHPSLSLSSLPSPSESCRRHLPSSDDDDDGGRGHFAVSQGRGKATPPQNVKLEGKGDVRARARLLRGLRQQWLT